MTGGRGAALAAPGGFLLPFLATTTGRSLRRPSGPRRPRKRPAVTVTGIGLVVTVVWAGAAVVSLETQNTATLAQISPVMLVVAGGLFAGGLRKEHDDE